MAQVNEEEAEINTFVPRLLFILLTMHQPLPRLSAQQAPTLRLSNLVSPSRGRSGEMRVNAGAMMRLRSTQATRWRPAAAEAARRCTAKRYFVATAGKCFAF